MPGSSLTWPVGSPHTTTVPAMGPYFTTSTPLEPALTPDLPAPAEPAPAGGSTDVDVDIDAPNLPGGALTGGFCRHHWWC
jgi:hypothetical protein